MAKCDIVDTMADFPSWVESHSVNCIACGKLIDERESYSTREGVGQLCEECFKRKKKYTI